MIGWECSRCGRFNGPWRLSCPDCPQPWPVRVVTVTIRLLAAEVRLVREAVREWKQQRA